MVRSDFNNLVKRTGRKLFGQAYRMLRDREGSEDAVQEVFIKLWKMGSRLDEYENVEALASTMIRNHCIDQLRRRKLTEKDYNNTYGPDDVNYPSPHDQLVKTESIMLMRRIIAGLPEMYRDIIQLRDIEEIPYEKIALMRGLNINTLRVNLSRARKIVRDEFRRFENEARGNKTTA